MHFSERTGRWGSVPGRPAAPVKWDAREVAFQPRTDGGDLESRLGVVRAPPASSSTSDVRC